MAQAIDTPDVGTGSGYGAVDASQAEQERKEGCMKKHPRYVLGFGLLGLTLVIVALMMHFAWPEKEPEWKQFVEYQKSFSKSYSKSEVQERFQAFKESLLEIARLRDIGSGSATFGLNQFSDLTAQEFADMYLNAELAGSDDDGQPGGLQSNLGDSPSSTSLNLTAQGYITPVRNQGGCGSCWAFACTGVIEMNYAQANGLSSDELENLRFSEQQVVSCDDVNYGCMGGWPVDAFKYIQSAGGMATEDDYPYKAQTGNCKSNKLNDLVEGTAPQEIDYGSYCGEWRDCSDVDEDSLAASMETNGAHVVAVNASPWQYYTGGVLSADECNADSGNGRRVLNHAVILTGFDISGDEKYWSIKNSWSSSWGDNGYIHIEYGSNACGVGNDALYVNL